LRGREREQVRAQKQREGEADSPASREPNAGPNPRTLGPRSKPKAAVQPIEPPRLPQIIHFQNFMRLLFF